MSKLQSWLFPRCTFLDFMCPRRIGCLLYWNPLRVPKQAKLRSLFCWNRCSCCWSHLTVYQFQGITSKQILQLYICIPVDTMKWVVFWFIKPPCTMSANNCRDCLVYVQRANVLVVIAALLYGTPRSAMEEKHVVKVGVIIVCRPPNYGWLEIFEHF